LLASGTGTVIGKVEGSFDLSEPSSSVSVTTRHYIDWAEAELNTATFGSASVVFKVAAVSTACPNTCRAEASKTLVDAVAGPSTMRASDIVLKLTLMNGANPLPPGRVSVHLIIELKAILGQGAVPSNGSPHATITEANNWEFIQPNP
jgi:hypothetical protein